MKKIGKENKKKIILISTCTFGLPKTTQNQSQTYHNFNCDKTTILGKKLITMITNINKYVLFLI